MNFESIYFLTRKDDETHNIPVANSSSCFSCFRKSKIDFEQIIGMLMEERKIKIVKYNEFEDFNQNNKIYYDTFTNRYPNRGTLYVKINKNYFVNYEDYSNKQWEFYIQLYKYLFIPLGLHSISINSVNTENQNNNSNVDLEAIKCQLNISYGNVNSLNSGKNVAVEYNKSNDLNDKIYFFQSKTVEEQIRFLKDRITNEHHQIIFSTSIDNKFHKVIERIEGKTKEIKEDINFKMIDNQKIRSSIKENISTYGIGISGSVTKEKIIIKDIKLEITFWDFDDTRYNFIASDFIGEWENSDKDWSVKVSSVENIHNKFNVSISDKNNTHKHNCILDVNEKNENVKLTVIDTDLCGCPRKIIDGKRYKENDYYCIQVDTVWRKKIFYS